VSLSGKQIVVGVCGSIAAYKVVQLVRNLVLAGARVDVVMTEGARHFVGEATFQAISGRPVLSDMWALPEDGVVGHVELGRHADAIVVAPATAQTLARLAHGFSDDLLATTILAADAPILLAPAMDGNMYQNPATQANVAALRSFGYTVLDPDEGPLASGLTGSGRLPDVEAIEAELRALLGRRSGLLAGRRVVVTAGGTHEPIDPVRYVGNRSSGLMGYALAAAARDRGADVTLISGPSALAPPGALRTVRVETALAMRDAVHAAIDQGGAADLLIMAAAVADFRPERTAEQKIKKGDDATLELRLVRNPDILGELAARRDLIKVGFAAETEALLENAQEKLRRKGLDLIVANEAVASIGAPESQITLIGVDGEARRLERLPKAQSAGAILDEVLRRFPDLAAART
jgi:phosphopantothenoylcysteine decarboxylase / phosphopantothenate---cysteine ligase